ncbi:hypothetical protein HYC85_009378 [Camellia sinensis]|uniref:NB-ARC domain-containing protein n=1 Tax=Camellia sinensis TaxID=4442 RepID=A0A7J7HHH7_CAMSI|nr:hypothetical protein HYC85_009378 [Camellia sinensis]
MKKMYKRVINLRDEVDQIREKILVNRPPETVKNMRAQDIKKIETLQKSLEQILDLLKGNKVKGIRIHGPLGIGKTTIMLNLNNHEQVAKMFDIVIWLKVSKEGSKENLSRKCLQLDIVQRLQLKMGDTSNADEVSQRILMELKDKNYLLLLDDVEDDINLYEIRIPYSNNRSKIVLTTRLHHVCSSMVKKEIKVTYLSIDEAWKMFQDVLGSPKLVENPEIGPLAWLVCRECGGLPLLIEKVANTFKLKNDMYLWSEGLNSWRMWPEKECQGIREMYKLLKFCYDDLDEDRQKKCFLYVSFTKLRNGNATQEVAFGHNMISKLSRLEELVIDMKSPEQWSNEVVENIIKEVASLKELKILKFCISNKVVDFIKLGEISKASGSFKFSLVAKTQNILKFLTSSSMKVPFNKKNAAKLQTIEAEQQWWEALQWQNDEDKEWYDILDKSFLFCGEKIRLIFLLLSFMDMDISVFVL